MTEETTEQATAAQERPSDIILIDTGATGDLFSSQLLEEHCPSENVISINPEVRKRYRYANNDVEVCSSQVRVRTKAGELDIDCREASTDKPSLLGIKTLRKYYIDIENLVLIPRPETDGQRIQLVNLPSGHIGVRAEELFS